MKVVTLKNLIPDPTMATGWNRPPTAEKSYEGEQSVKLEGTVGTAEVLCQTTAGIPLNPSHLYYVRVYGWQDIKTTCSIGFYWPVAEPNFREGISPGSAGQWNLYSAVNDRNQFATGSYPLRLDFNNLRNAGTMYYDAPMLIDLTETFGTGKEPTQAWMDTYVPFFIGTMEIDTYPTDVFEISSFDLSPNPATINSKVSAKAVVTEKTEILMPDIRYTNEFYAGEV